MLIVLIPERGENSDVCLPCAKKYNLTGGFDPEALVPKAGDTCEVFCRICHLESLKRTKTGALIFKHQKEESQND